MPQYRYTTTVKAPTGVALRFDSDSSGTTPATVYANAQGAPIDQTNPRQMVHSDQRDGTIQTVFGDVPTVYVRGIDYKGNVVAGVIATIAGDLLGQSNQHGALQKLASWAPYTYDIREFATDAAPIVNANGSVADIGPAITAFLAAMASTTTPRKLFVPDGTYKILQSGTDAPHSANYGVLWGDKLGLVGESMGGTIIQSDAGSTPFYHAYGAATLSDIEFGNMTIDCSAQTNGSYTTQLKAMFMQDIQRLHVHDIRFVGSWATSLGCDALVDYLIHDLIIENPGRGIGALALNPASVSGGSGVGVGTGKYQSEPGIVHDIVVHGAGRCALFYEKQSAYSFYSRGHVARGVKSIGSWAGLHDAGCDGLDAEINATDGTYGVLLDLSTLAPNAGFNGNVVLASKRNSGGDVALGKVSANAFQIIDGPYVITGSGKSGPGASRTVYLAGASLNAKSVAVSLDPVSTTVLAATPTGDLYADNFGAADGTLAAATAGDGSSSTTWAFSDGGTGGVMGRVSGVAKATAGTGTILALLTTGQADGACHVTLTARPGTDTGVVAGMAIRATDANNYLQVSTRQSASVAGYTVVARVAGAGTNLITTTKIPTAGDVVKVAFNGQFVSLYVNGVLLGTGVCNTTALGSGLVANTKHGVFGNFAVDPTSTLDAFGYNTVATS
jgi:hypothetical protein